MLVIGRHQRESVAEERGEPGGLDPFLGAVAQDPADVLLGQCGDDLGQAVGHLGRQLAAVLGLAEPLRHPFRQLEALQLRCDHFVRQEMVLDEVAEHPPDPVLLILDDGGMGNRNA